jgi:hypothetical protein
MAHYGMAWHGKHRDTGVDGEQSEDIRAPRRGYRGWRRQLFAKNHASIKHRHDKNTHQNIHIQILLNSAAREGPLILVGKTVHCSAVQCSTTILLAETGVELRFQETYLDGLGSFK